MPRQTAWALALVMTCAPAPAALAGQRDAQVRAGQAPVPDLAPGKESGRKDQTEPAQKDTSQAARTKPEERERWKWWLYDRVALSITDRQSADINQIFEATIPKLRESREELDRAEKELSRTIKEHKADLATISMLVDRVESARSLNTKMRVLMLYRISLLLNPDQRVKLEALREQHDRERRDREPARKRRP